MPKPISLHVTLMGESVTFLQETGMQCVVTQEGLVKLISQLVYYREEGHALYPEIYIIDDLRLVAKMLPTSQFCAIGDGPKVADTMLTALKKCAPLTEGGWSIYILRQQTSFSYGLFKAGTSLLSTSIGKTLIDNGNPSVRVILIHQIADRIIEVKGVMTDSLMIGFGAHLDGQSSPIALQEGFIKKIIEKVPENLKEQTTNFYSKIFLEVLKKGHGTLACVVNGRSNVLSNKLKDGIILQERINVPMIVQDVLTKNDLFSNAILEGQFSLISGMMQSDGVTIFTDTGKVAGYNVFVKHPRSILAVPTSGGARSRTYLTLCQHIGTGLKSAYIQSQDGKIQFQ